MIAKAIAKINAENLRKDAPQFGIGDNVRVHVKIREGDKERVQVFAGAVISRDGRGSTETFTVRRIAFGVGVVDLMSRRRARSALDARDVATLLASRLNGLSTTTLGRLFGGRDHSTICSALKRAKRREAADANFAADVRRAASLRARRAARQTVLPDPKQGSGFFYPLTQPQPQCALTQPRGSAR